jgi:hypothetical protein
LNNPGPDISVLIVSRAFSQVNHPQSSRARYENILKATGSRDSKYLG